MNCLTQFTKIISLKDRTIAGITLRKKSGYGMTNGYVYVYIRYVLRYLCATLYHGQPLWYDADRIPRILEFLRNGF